jgi:hypothetical protein
MSRNFPVRTPTGHSGRPWPWHHGTPSAQARTGRVWPAFLTCCWLLASLVWASDDSLLKVEPDRPTVSNSTHTAPVRALQVELGLEYARSHNDTSATERRLAVQTTLRTGLSDRFEVRLDGEPLVRLKEEHDDIGLGDMAVGVKYRFFEPPEGQGGPALGVQPFLKLPTARTPIGSGRLDSGVLVLADQDLRWEVQLTVNAGLVAVGQPHGYLLQGLVSASVTREFWGRLSPFVEVFFASRDERDGHNTVGLDTGIVYLLTRRIAIDAAAETTLNRHRPDYALRTGLSLLLGR